VLVKHIFYPALVPSYFDKQVALFERQMLRRIYGPVKTEGGYRRRNNNALDKLIRADIVKYVREQMIKRWGCLNRLGKKKKKQRGRSRNGIA
jgi:hypothetical protein